MSAEQPGMQEIFDANPDARAAEHAYRSTPRWFIG
jgi:hypothetical protein